MQLHPPVSSCAWRCSGDEVSAQGGLCRGVCVGVSLARLTSCWGDENSVHKAPTPSLQVQRDVRVSVPLLHLTCMSSIQRGRIAPLYFPYKGKICVCLSLAAITPAACPPLASLYSPADPRHMQTAWSTKFAFCYLSPLSNFNCSN